MLRVVQLRVQARPHLFHLDHDVVLVELLLCALLVGSFPHVGDDTLGFPWLLLLFRGIEGILDIFHLGHC